MGYWVSKKRSRFTRIVGRKKFREMQRDLRIMRLLTIWLSGCSPGAVLGEWKTTRVTLLLEPSGCPVESVSSAV